MLTALEVKAAKTAVLTSALALAVTFIAGEIYWQHTGRLERAKQPAGPAAVVAQGRLFSSRVVRIATAKMPMDARMLQVYKK